MTYFDKRLKEWVELLEKHTLSEVMAYLADLKKTAEIDYNLFIYLLYNENILQELYQQRVKLAVIASSPAKVVALPEDRGRIVLLLAKCVKYDFNKAREIFAREFGPGFQLREDYLVGGRSIGWKRLAQKASEIKNGIYNVCYLQVQEVINEIMAYYKIFKVTDQDQLLKILNLTKDIKDELVNSPLLSTAAKESKPILKKVKELYSATGRLKMEIDELDYEPDFAEIQEYAFFMSFVCIARAAAVKNRVAPGDWEYAKRFLTRVIGQTKFMSLQSTDELQRLHKPLMPAQK